MSQFVVLDQLTRLNVTDEGYPSLTCGTTDKNKNFHPFGISVSMHETGDDFEFMFNGLKNASSKILGLDYSPNILLLIMQVR